MAHTFDDNIVSDLHKDAYGFRPGETFWEQWDARSDDEKQKVWDDLLEALEHTMAIEAKMQKYAIETFEVKVAEMIACGAKTREDALRWMMQASDCDDDLDYFCYKHGLPYGYFNKSVMGI